MGYIKDHLACFRVKSTESKDASLTGYLENRDNISILMDSKIGNRWEKIFHVWRSFHFDENVDTSHSYMTCIRQAAALLDCGEPQILEVFKTHFLQNYIGSSFL